MPERPAGWHDVGHRFSAIWAQPSYQKQAVSGYFSAMGPVHHHFNKLEN
jgi:hypothetical protein